MANRSNGSSNLSEIPTLLLLGLGLVLIGMVMIFLSLWIQCPEASTPDKLCTLSLAVLGNIGTTLLPAGILAGALEPILRKRQRQDVEELKQANFVSLLKGVMPEAVFDEVNRQIIRYPFIRRNFQVTIVLEWAEPKHQYLTKLKKVKYEVESISPGPTTYIITTNEERSNVDSFPNSTQVKRVRVSWRGSEKKKEVLYENEKLNRYRNDTNVKVGIKIPVELAYGEQVEIEVEVTAVHPVNDTYWAVTNKAALGYEMYVSHPAEIEVRAGPLHPTNGPFDDKISKETVSQWHISQALLPWQGMYLSWKPRSDEQTTPSQPTVAAHDAQEKSAPESHS